MLTRIRQFLRSDMKVLRWVFLALYVLLVAGLIAPWFFSMDTILVGPILLAGMLGTQALFIFGAGTIELCRPIRRRRVILPLIVAACMLTLLLAGAAIALGELAKLHDPVFGILVGAHLVANWLFWFAIFWAYSRRWDRQKALARMTAAMFAGSLLELMVTVPSHVVVSKRPGCLVGLNTMLGIIAGVCVMVWSFGPAIFLLFLRPRYRREKAALATQCTACGYDLRGSIPAGSRVCPECGAAIAGVAPRGASEAGSSLTP